MKQHLKSALLMTAVTVVILGLAYPLGITAVAHLVFPRQAEGSLVVRGGMVVGSTLIAQPFAGPGYFHPRPSAAGDAGYDPQASGGSNLAATNRKLIERVSAAAARLSAENPGRPVPVDLVTASGSGLDPDITPAAAEFQVPRVARERGMPEEEVRSVVKAHTRPRQFGILGEPRVNVLELNQDLGGWKPTHAR